MKKIKSFMLFLLTMLCGVSLETNAFCGISWGGSPATPPPHPPPTCYCATNKVAIKRMLDNSCLEEKCIAAGVVLHYLSQGWIYGCCAVARLEATGATATSFISVYPNPAAGSTIISFSLSEQQKVSLKIFDMTGGLFATLTDGNFDAGENVIRWNAAVALAGIYLLRFETGDYLRTEKLIVTKN